MKPKQILDLEKELGFEIREVKTFNEFYDRKKSYILDKEEEIIGLNLSYCDLKDISFLKDLITLEHLDLTRNQITDISPLQNLTKLKDLELLDNFISDFSFLKNLINLESFLANKGNVDNVFSFQENSWFNYIILYFKERDVVVTSIWTSMQINEKNKKPSLQNYYDEMSEHYEKEDLFNYCPELWKLLNNTIMIKSLKISNFLGREININFFPDVNVFIGLNGSGKSFLLNILKEAFTKYDENIDKNVFQSLDEVVIDVKINEFKNSVIVIDSHFRNITNERYLKNLIVQKIDSREGEEGWNKKADKLRGDFFQYYAGLSMEIQQIFNDKQYENLKITQISEKVFNKLNLFEKFINELFEQTDKKFSSKDFAFTKPNKNDLTPPQQLSSGEKQIFYILLYALLQNNKPSVLLIDDIESNLHITRQHFLLNMIRELNPNCQIICTTHSPQLFCLDWKNNYRWVNNL